MVVLDNQCRGSDQENHDQPSVFDHPYSPCPFGRLVFPYQSAPKSCTSATRVPAVDLQGRLQGLITYPLNQALKRAYPPALHVFFGFNYCWVLLGDFLKRHVCKGSERQPSLWSCRCMSRRLRGPPVLAVAAPKEGLAEPQSVAVGQRGAQSEQDVRAGFTGLQLDFPLRAPKKRMPMFHVFSWPLGVGFFP